MTEQSAVSNPSDGAESNTHHGAATRPLRIAIVGAGPAGIYAADAPMKSDTPAGFDGVSIDLYERMPAPFGLIRYGVAPDHRATERDGGDREGAQHRREHCEHAVAEQLDTIR